MSAAEERINAQNISEHPSIPIGDRIINFLSSVRFGIVQLCVLVVLSMIGMLVVQQNVPGFDVYYASLTPSEKMLFGRLGFFDIYHSWYFNLLLLSLSLNIILASIDRFPSAWSYISTPKKSASPEFISKLQQVESLSLRASDPGELTAELRRVFEKNGLKVQESTTESRNYATDADGRKQFDKIVLSKQQVVFGESGRLNRLGAYVVHVALLTLFLGHFVALVTGFDADVRMIPGDATDKIQMIAFDLDKKEKFEVQLPFTMTCTDIQQRLIDPAGSIDVSNTLDWRTQLRVDDPEYGQTIADISMNKPFHYLGFRFFQAQTIPLGNARSITLELTPQDSSPAQTIEIPRMGSTTLPDGTLVEYDQFLPDFSFNSEGDPDTRTGEYNNPVAVLNVTPPQGSRTRVFAFASKLADNMPVGAPKLGYKWRLAAFEKSPFAHVLSIKYDPYNGAFVAWYLGGFGLVGALAFVFFASHKRIWALVQDDENGRTKVLIGGDSNRNPLGLENKFKKIVSELRKSAGNDRS